MRELIHCNDRRLQWHGAISVERTDAWAAPWRIPYRERELYWPGGGLGRAAMPAGVRLSFSSDTTRVAGAFEQRPPPALADPQEVPRIDLACDGRVLATQNLAGREAFAFDGLPPGDKVIELWLPHFSQFRLRELELTPAARVERWDDPRPRWIAYGSSITQGRGAASPSETWTSIVARAEGLNLISMGFGAGCHAEPMFARLIRDTPADMVFACLGINVWFSACMSGVMFRSVIIGFIALVREGHPHVPIVICSPIYSPDRESRSNALGIRFAAIRDEVRQAVAVVCAHGDDRVFHLDGRALLGPDQEDLYLAEVGVDRVHPDPDGHRALAHNFRTRVAGPLALIRGVRNGGRQGAAAPAAGVGSSVAC
jgi:hypothetical protein